MNRPCVCINTLTGPSEHGCVHGQVTNIKLGAEGQMSHKAHTLGLAAPISTCACTCPHLSQCKITPLCPHISVADCCLHWMTPHGLKHLNSLSGHLLPELIARERVMLVKVVKPKTLSNYSAGLLQFTQFCDAFDIPEDLCMPALEWLLSNSSLLEAQGCWGVVL